MGKLKVFVTGGAGFIGSNIVKNHLERGDTVWAVDNLQTGNKSNIAPFLANSSFRFDEADMRAWPHLIEAVHGADRIYHMAANVGQRFVISQPLNTLTDNIESYEVLLKALATSPKKGRLLLASTSEVYRFCPASAEGSLEESLVSLPSGKYIQETYPLGKLVNEVMTLGYIKEKGIWATIARLFNTIGPNQSPAYGMVVPTFIQQAVENRPLTVYGDGTQTRSFCDIRDVTEAFFRLLESDAALGEIVNVGNYREFTIQDLAKEVIEVTQSKSNIEFVPYKKAYGFDFIDVKARKPNLQKIKQITGFSPKWTLRETLKEIIHEKIPA
jgi:UDP-glucose 4-epimerase